jgi:hypothetical protein
MGHLTVASIWLFCSSIGALPDGSSCDYDETCHALVFTGRGESHALLQTKRSDLRTIESNDMPISKKEHQMNEKNKHVVSIHTDLPETSKHEMVADKHGVPSRKESSSTRGDVAVDVVVKAWREDLRFLDSMLESIPGVRLKLYCSSSALEDARCIDVPNIGAENWAYLHHITENYESLPPITVFTLGNIMSDEWGWLKCRKLNFVLNKLNTIDKQRNFSGYESMAGNFLGTTAQWIENFDITFYRAAQGAEKLEMSPPSVRPLGEWYSKFVSSNHSAALMTGMQYNGIFAVSRERLQTWPRSVWMDLKEELGRWGPSPKGLVGDHYMERSWKPMLDHHAIKNFHQDGVDECPDLIQQLTIQQKS